MRNCKEEVTENIGMTQIETADRTQSSGLAPSKASVPVKAGATSRAGAVAALGRMPGYGRESSNRGVRAQPVSDVLAGTDLIRERQGLLQLRALQASDNTWATEGLPQALLSLLEA